MAVEPSEVTLAAKDDPEEQRLRTETHDVALGNESEKDHNTIVLTGVDLVLPLEMDVDGDPLQDDEANLRSASGHYDRTLTVAHPDVTPDKDNGQLLYRFRDVPPGHYRVAVKVANRWVPVLRGIIITKNGAFVGDKKLETDVPEVKAAAPPEDAGDAVHEAPMPSHCGH